MRRLLQRSFVYQPPKQPSFQAGKCLIFRDKVLESLRTNTIGFAGVVGVVSSWKSYNASGWLGRGSFGVLALGALGALKLWQMNALTMAHCVYLLPDGKHIEVHFLGTFRPTIQRIPVKDIMNTTDEPEFEILSEGVKAYLVTLHSGKQFTIDLNGIIPDRKLLGAILQGETIDLRSYQDTISV